ncbi:MCE family protein [Gordonia soli]|uniref:Mce family protein n=1 Tax=Gordonia soli NBRC 108243 TaxID=1223545 RepID=M0QHZ8_9ACTN|nr:MCE family protein [Gordonia soli]GAC68074.1 Mce family protein [Gordonia soli NBRC 108243]
MDNRARAFRATLIKLAAFTVVMILVFVALVVVFSRYRSGSTNDYTAVFTSASAMKSGSKVKIAGVEVGSVSGVSLNRANEAEVDFDVDEKYPLPKSVRALIRYENLTGDRYLELQQGSGGAGQILDDGARIPIAQTEPALDLDKLLGGFKPLFRTLNPKEVNELSSSLIAVFQGQGQGLRQLLSSTSEFTNSLADRDQLIGQVIDNLNTTLGTLQKDQQGFDTSLDLLQQLVSGLSAQRATIGSALTETAQLTNGLSSLLATTRPDIQSTLTNTGKVSEEVLKAGPYVSSLIKRLPDDFKKLSNLGSYGAWLQIWLCKVRLIFTGPGNQQILWTNIDATGDKTNPAGRCAPPQ